MAQRAQSQTEEDGSGRPVLSWGVQTAQAERGFTAIGGEYLFLLIPFMYYPGKRTVLDWIADLRELRREG